MLSCQGSNRWDPETKTTRPSLRRRIKTENHTATQKLTHIPPDISRQITELSEYQWRRRRLKKKLTLWRKVWTRSSLLSFFVVMMGATRPRILLLLSRLGSSRSRIDSISASTAIFARYTYTKPLLVSYLASYTMIIRYGGVKRFGDPAR